MAASTDGLDDTALVRAAARAAHSLAEDASRLEREGVTRSVLDDLAEAGLLGAYGPPGLGGATAPVQRRVAELLSGASPDAWFVWFQHGPVVKMLTASENLALQDRYLADLCSGRCLGGVAWSHLRTATPTVHAARVPGGWSLTGFQPWNTGWGLSDVVLVGALVPATDEVLFGLVPSGPQPGLASAGELGLAAMAGTSTHALRLDGLLVPDDAVVLRTERGPWAEADLAGNTNVQPSTFGIALAALDLLAAREPSDAARLRAPLLAVRAEAYRLLDEVPVGEQLDERLALRARALVLAMDCTTALLASRGGQGMDLGQPAQRLLRAAMFQVVHSQAAHVRTATLAALGR